MTVTRIDTGFLGHAELVCFLEDTDTQWLAQAMWLSSEVEAAPSP